jgi:hypothetical protein
VTRSIRASWIVLVVVVWVGHAQAQNVPVWGLWERAFSSHTSAAPDTGLTVDLVAPSGKAFTAAGFWDGGATWRVRFMPTEAGRWQYRTQSVPPVEGLDRQSGEFFSESAAATTRFLQHGPVRVSANGRFFEHSDGTPFFWMGDTVWYGAILSSRADWETYLADRVGKRFDVVHFNVVAPRNGVAADENGQISFLGRAERDPVRMNPRFYQRLDERIAAVNAHGLLAGIVLTWALRSDDSGNSLAEDDVVRVIRYLVARYGAQHVVWILTGDSDYAGAAGERWRRIGRTVFGGTEPHAPVTTHPGGMVWPWEAFRDEAWLDFLIYQSGHGDDAKTLRWIHSGPPSRHWQDPPPRPFINIEPPYEGHLGYESRRPHTDYSTRRAIYWSLLNAPTAGVTYGAHGVWSWHTAVGRPPTDHPSTGVAKTWREALSFPGSTQMRHLEAFFTSIAWWRLRPDQRLIVGQPGAADSARHIAASRSEEGDLAVVYLPTGGNVRLDGRLLKRGLNAEWFDPRTGSRSPVAGPPTSEFVAPDSQDWVLRLSAR